MGNIREISDKLKKYIDSKEGVKAQYSVTESETREITMENGEFSLFRTLYDNDVTVKVIKDNKIGNASSNKTEEKELFNTVDSALSAAEAGEADPAYDIAPGMEPAVFHKGPQEPDIDKLMFRAKEFSDEISKNHPDILVMQLMFKYVKKHSFYRNTNGSEDEVSSGYYTVSAEFSGNDGEKSSSLFGSGVGLDNLDKPFIEIGSIKKELEDAAASINPEPVVGKFEGPVIFTPGGMAQMLMYALGVLAGNDVILSKESKWIDKIDKQVASPILTLGIKPNDKRILGTSVRTQDGFRAEDFNIIENGILKSYMANLYISNKCKVERAKSSDYDFVIEAGDLALEDMIKSMDRGLIVGAVSCGYPSANCEISGVAKNSFYVENGKIKHSLAETMVSFSLCDMFMNIEELSKEVVLDGGVVMPYVKVGGITISGK